MESMHKAHLPLTEVRRGLLRKHLCDCFELRAKLFFHEMSFLPEGIPDSLGLFPLEYLVDIFSKMDKENNFCH